MKIQTNVKNTESPEKLREHIKKLIPTAELTQEKNQLKGEADFQDIWQRAEEQKIRKTLLEELKSNRKAEKTHLYLDKLGASTGKLSIYVNSATGKITLEIPWKEVEKHKEINK